MYNRPELQAGNRQYWQLLRQSIARRDLAAPEQLSDAIPDKEYWLRPDLCLSQTCGLPYRRYLNGKVTYVGTPHIDIDGCAPGYYRSVIVVRYDDARSELSDFLFPGVRLACNSLDSQSGFAAIANHDGGILTQYAKITITGSHAASAIAVARGEADIAAIDYTTWRFMLRYDSFTRELRVLELTCPSPALPYISAISVDAKTMYAAINEAIDSMSRGLKQLLRIEQIVWVEPADYLRVPTPLKLDCVATPFR